MVLKIQSYAVVLVLALIFFGVLALPVLAHGDSGRERTSKQERMRGDKATTTSATSTESTRRGKGRGGNVDASCMQTAVDTREESLMTAFGTFHDAIETALEDRKDALHDAWGMEAGSDRNKALKDAWKGWIDAHKAAFKAFKDARKKAWDAFRKTVKDTCRESLPKEETLPKDEAGSVAM